MTAPAPDDGAARNGPAIFGEHAVALRRAGLAVLPANGKRPLIRGFQKMRCAPGLAIVEQWAQTNASHNIVYVPGLSRTRGSPNGLVVVDADNAEEVERVEKVFGPTPAMVVTRRGRHFIYGAPEASLCNIGSLRKVGLDVDIKHGQRGSGISVAPPSRHPDQPDFTYTWQKGSGPDSLTDLPPFNAKALQSLIEEGAKRSSMLRGSETLLNVTQTAPPPPRRMTAGIKRGPLTRSARHFPECFGMAAVSWA